VQVFTAVWLLLNVITFRYFEPANRNIVTIFEADKTRLSGKMLTLFIILGLIAAAAAATLYLRRTKHSSEMLERQAQSGAENFRPLFKP
jgi:H+/Cl- antiporter ClcA